jgi:hypothetical protein
MSTVSARPPNGTIALSTDVIRCRVAGDRDCSSFASARADASSKPVTAPSAAARSPTAMATASSGDRVSGGTAAPAPSR